MIHTLIIGPEQGPSLRLGSVANKPSYSIKAASSLSEATDILNQQPVDVVVLDLHHLPESDLELSSQLRGIWSGPLLALAMQPAARICALELGADCCLCPEVSIDEFDAQIRALMRCAEREHVALARKDAGLLALEPLRKDAVVDEQWLGLTHIEYRVLEALMAQQGQVMERGELYQQVFFRKWTKHDRVLDIHVSRIRKKLQSAGYPSARLKSVWRVGYALTQ